MSRFFGFIKKFLSKNYWLQPVLLVAVIFALVFSIQGITTLVEKIGNSISGEGKCTDCKDITYEQLEGLLEEATDENPVIVLVTTDDCAGCQNVYKKISAFLDIKAYKDYKFFRIEIQEDEEKTQVGKEVYDDETLTKAKLDALKMDIYEWLKEKDNTDLNTKPGEYDSFQIKTPTLVVFGSEQSGYENNQVIKVLENITTTSNSGKDTTIDTLRKFFTDVNIGDYKEPFPWWAWALCIGGGVGAIFAIFLVIKKNKKH
jgi:hypothetical protein